MDRSSNGNKNSEDLVKKYEILKAQVALEDKARTAWMKRWNFYLDFPKICVEEAIKKGYTEEGYKSLVVFRKKTSKFSDCPWEVKGSTQVPTTSAGFVGWRSRLEDSLMKLGPLYVSPKHTLPQEPHVSHIILG